MQAGDGAIERAVVARFEPEERRVVRAPLLHDDPMGLGVVAPCVRLVAGHEADHFAEERVERRGIGDVEADVGDLDLVHGHPLGKRCSVFVCSGEPHLVDAVGSRRDDGLGGERPVAAVVQVVRGRQRRQRVEGAGHGVAGQVEVQPAEVTEHVDVRREKCGERATRGRRAGGARRPRGGR